MGKNTLYTLIPLEEFRSILNIDDREEKLARFCLVTGTLEIERYCMRKFLRKQFFEIIDFNEDLVLPLREYPVQKVQAIFLMKNNEILEPEFYNVIPECGTDIDFPFEISLSPVLRRYPVHTAIKVVYCAGYAHNKVPNDLSSACMELATWNMNRYRGRRIGMTGNIHGAGKEGEHFEMSMPQNVKALLEPYRRKTI